MIPPMIHLRMVFRQAATALRDRRHRDRQEGKPRPKARRRQRFRLLQ